MIKISVCDDDSEQISFFRQCFLKYNEKQGEKIEAKFYQSIREITDEADFLPDVYFLDIELQDGNGMKFASDIRKKNPRVLIVFITSHTEFMPEAFKVHAYGYINKKRSVYEVENILNQLQDYFLEEGKKFTFHAYGEIITLNCMDIICMKSEKRKNVIVAATGEFEYYGKFSDEVKRLPEKNFVVLRNNFAINMDYISTVDRLTVYYEIPGIIGLQSVAITRKYRDLFFEKYEAYRDKKYI